MTLLAGGRIEIEGRMPWSSNGTFLCTVTAPDPHPGGGASGGDAGAASAGEEDPADETLPAIYKPLRTERPLWDFPNGLYRREVAAYELAIALGWDLVPETVERIEDAPLGLGSLQRFVDADFEQHYFTLLEDDVHHPALRRMAVFDILANNADRKGGHCLVDGDGHIWGIDHGLCFHTAPKLRTVIWDFVGEDIADDLLADVAAFVERGLSPALRHLLVDAEPDALLRRAEGLLLRPRFPQPRTDHPYPWPLV